MSELKEMSFEAALTRLDEILKMLESGNAPLDKSISLFEEGVALSKHCNKLLDTAEQKVVMLTRDEAGSLAEVPFETPTSDGSQT